MKRIIAPTAAGSLQPMCIQAILSSAISLSTAPTGAPTPSMMDRGHPHQHGGALPPAASRSGCPGGEAGRAHSPRWHRGRHPGSALSTAAESRWFSQMGWHVVNMTQYPECVLARELEICYTNISLITDYDAGLVGLPGIEPVSVEKMLEVFHQNNARVKELILGMIEVMPESRDCDCGCALRTARIE